MIDPLNVWQSTFDNMPKVADTSWSSNFANWASERVTGKAELTGITNPSPAIFTFNASAFQTALMSLTPTTNSAQGAQNFANAWEQAMLSSAVLSIVPGAFLGSSSPATTWSVVSSAIIDPPSIVVAKAKILEIATAPMVGEGGVSKFPEIFRDAYLLLTGTVTGMNSVPPTAGPNPLVAALVSLI